MAQDGRQIDAAGERLSVRARGHYQIRWLLLPRLVASLGTFDRHSRAVRHSGFNALDRFARRRRLQQCTRLVLTRGSGTVAGEIDICRIASGSQPHCCWSSILPHVLTTSDVPAISLVILADDEGRTRTDHRWSAVEIRRLGSASALQNCEGKAELEFRRTRREHHGGAVEWICRRPQTACSSPGAGFQDAADAQPARHRCDIDFATYEAKDEASERIDFWSLVDFIADGNPHVFFDGAGYYARGLVCHGRAIALR